MILDELLMLLLIKMDA